MAIDFPVGTDFPGGDIPDGHEHEGFYWDAAAGAWKRICDDVDLDKIYLKRHGDTVDDCTAPADYIWNQSVSIEALGAIELSSTANKESLKQLLTSSCGVGQLNMIT